MRSILMAVLALTLAAGFGSQQAAAAKQKKYKSHSAPYAKHYSPSPSPYQERLLESAPFGSKLWWELLNPPVAGR